MFLPPQYLWLEPVIIAAVVVFVVDLIGNTLTFSNRFVNALVTSVVFALSSSACLLRLREHLDDSDFDTGAMAPAKSEQTGDADFVVRVLRSQERY
jgi:hypothetical protein